MILYYKKKDSFRSTKVLVKQVPANGGMYFNCEDDIPPKTILYSDGLCKVPLYKVLSFTTVHGAHGYFKHEVVPVDIKMNEVKIRHLGTGLDSTHMGIPDSKLYDELDAIENDLLSDGPPEETDCTPEEAMDILNSVDLPIIKSIYEPFKKDEKERVNLFFYIPRSVFTNLKDAKYVRELKQLNLKTDVGLEGKNKNTYYKCTITAEIPNEEIRLKPNKLYNILVNCGVNKTTAETAIKTAIHLGELNE